MAVSDGLRKLRALVSLKGSSVLRKISLSSCASSQWLKLFLLTWAILHQHGLCSYAILIVPRVSTEGGETHICEEAACLICLKAQREQSRSKQGIYIKNCLNGAGTAIQNPCLQGACLLIQQSEMWRRQMTHNQSQPPAKLLRGSTSRPLVKQSKPGSAITVVSLKPPVALPYPGAECNCL